jgi:polyisoprenoid-binding protein YceI
LETNVLRSRSFWALLASSVLLASCAQPTRLPPKESTVTRPARPPEIRGADIYRVVAQQSKLHILVYRGGRFARLGHNHVVSSPDFAGRVWLHPQFDRSGFELSIPVQTLIVDDPKARAAHGEEFPPDLPHKDVEGTRKNILRAEVLDAETYPEISLRSARLDGSQSSPTLVAQVTIKGVTREMSIPIALSLQDARLIATGDFDLLQTDFGMKPFSVAFGALEVQDRLHLEYRIVAERES